MHLRKSAVKVVHVIAPESLVIVEQSRGHQHSDYRLGFIRGQTPDCLNSLAREWLRKAGKTTPPLFRFRRCQHIKADADHGFNQVAACFSAGGKIPDVLARLLIAPHIESSGRIS